MARSKLTPNQEKFVDYYLELGQASPAYRKAYPSCKKDTTAEANGWRLLRNAKVKAYMEERVKIFDEERIAKLNEVFRFWTETMRTETKEVTTEDGRKIVVPYDMKDRLKASENLARSRGAFIDNINQRNETTIKHTHDFSNLSKEEIKELLGRE